MVFFDLAGADFEVLVLAGVGLGAGVDLVFSVLGATGVSNFETISLALGESWAPFFTQ